MLKLIAVSGSLRAGSANTALLLAAAALAPPQVSITLFDGVGALPHFNPDIEADPPQSVQAWRALVGECDGVLIACPEYAHGIPGAFKNALDWIVGNAELTGKRFLLINTSHRAVHALAALAEVLATMGWIKLAEPVIPVANRGLDARAIAADADLAGQIGQAIRYFLDDPAR